MSVQVGYTDTMPHHNGPGNTDASALAQVGSEAKPRTDAVPAILFEGGRRAEGGEEGRGLLLHLSAPCVPAHLETRQPHMLTLKYTIAGSQRAGARREMKRAGFRGKWSTSGRCCCILWPRMSQWRASRRRRRRHRRRKPVQPSCECEALVGNKARASHRVLARRAILKSAPQRCARHARLPLHRDLRAAAEDIFLPAYVRARRADLPDYKVMLCMRAYLLASLPIAGLFTHAQRHRPKSFS